MHRLPCNYFTKNDKRTEQACPTRSEGFFDPSPLLLVTGIRHASSRFLCQPMPSKVFQPWYQSPGRAGFEVCWRRCQSHRISFPMELDRREYENSRCCATTLRAGVQSPPLADMPVLQLQLGLGTFECTGCSPCPLHHGELYRRFTMVDHPRRKILQVQTHSNLVWLLVVNYASIRQTTWLNSLLFSVGLLNIMSIKLWLTLCRILSNLSKYLGSPA